MKTCIQLKQTHLIVVGVKIKWLRVECDLEMILFIELSLKPTTVGISIKSQHRGRNERRRDGA